MKRIDLGKTVTLIANVGVIGGILLLAYELRQNNELKAAEARKNTFHPEFVQWMEENVANH